MVNTLDLRSLKMSWVRFLQTKEKTSGVFSNPSAGSQMNQYQFLDLRSGSQPDVLSGMGPVWHGVFTTQEVGAYPKDVRDSTLSQILQENAPKKYYLSSECANGILTRAKVHNQLDTMPPLLRRALEKAVNGENVPKWGGQITTKHISSYPIDVHQQHHRFNLWDPDSATPTLTRKMGTGGNNTPMILQVKHDK